MEHRYFNLGQVQPVRDVEVIDISNDQEDSERHSAGLYATAQPSPLRVTSGMEHTCFNFGQIQPVRDVEVIDISNDQEDNERHSAVLYATAQPSPPKELCRVGGMGIADDLEEKEHKISSSIPSATPDPSSTEALCFTPQASGTSLIGACVAPQGSTERLFAGPSCGVQQACRLGNVDRTRSTLSMDHGDKAGIDAGVSKPMTVEAGEVTEKEVERSKSSSRYQQRKQRKRELKVREDGKE